MKKVLAFVLAATLFCVYLPTTVLAYAPTNIIGMSEGADILINDKIEDFGNIILGTQSNILEIPFDVSQFTSNGTPLTDDDITEDILNNLKIHSNPPAILTLFEPHIEWEHHTVDSNAKIVLTAVNVGVAIGHIWVEWLPTHEMSNKEVINGIFIDPTVDKKIVGIKDANLTRGGVYLDGTLISTPLEAIEYLDVRSGSELAFKLDTDTFIWDLQIDDMQAKVRKSTLDSDEVSLIKRIGAGSKAIKNISIKNINGCANIVVEFNDMFDSVNSLDFSFDIALSQKDVRNESTMVVVSGKLSNETIEVNSDNDEVNCDSGEIVEATQFVKNIKITTNAGVSFTTDLFPNKKYYIRATEERTDIDTEIMEHYAFFKKVIHIKKVNYSDNISINIDSDEEMYVYDGQGQYLGTTKENLKFADTYYLSAEKYAGSMDYSQEVPQDANANNNPSTGCSSAWMLSLAGMAIMLVGAAVLCAARWSIKTK